MNRVMASVMLICITLLCGFPKAQAYSLYRVGDEIVGKKYNEVYKRWFHNEFSIWVGIDHRNTEYIFFKGETALGDATVMVKNTKATRGKLKTAVAKAIEWSGIARKNQADTLKSLGCFGRNAYNLCEEHGKALEKNAMGLSFFANNGGKQTDLILSIIDQDNKFIKTTIYIDVPEMKKLLNVVEEIQIGFEKARKIAKNQKLFN